MFRANVSTLADPSTGLLERVTRTRVCAPRIINHHFIQAGFSSVLYKNNNDTKKCDESVSEAAQSLTGKNKDEILNKR